MKIRTIEHIFKEGFLNAYRNKLMSLASITIVTAALVVFGIFLLLIFNIDYNSKLLKDKMEIQVYCNPDLGDEQIQQISERISQNSGVKESRMITKKEALEKVKGWLENGNKLLEGYSEEILPIAFIVTLQDADDSDRVSKELLTVPGVDKVDMPYKTLQMVSRFTHWANLISICLIIILLAISIFIISNTIKLTVYARRKEINIMKYVGATDWFIRWPFIIEGVIIGFIGAIVAFVLIGYGYGALAARINGDFEQISKDFIKLMTMAEIGLKLFLSYLLLGSVVGAAGSFMSIRKHLHV